jgi:hypothetical protein
MQAARVLALAAIALSTSFPTNAHALTAAVEADGYSFSLQPTGTSLGFDLFFTSFDGLSGVPLLDCTGGVFCYVSDEAMPVFPGSRTFRTDYLASDAQGVFEYGTATLTVSTTDGDGDGQLDQLERVNTGNFSASGTAVPDFNAFGVYVNSAITVSLRRSAGSRTGTYSGSFANATQSAAFASSFGLSGANGSIAYDFGGETLLWSLQQRGFGGEIRNFTGLSTINRISADEIEIPSFSLFDSSMNRSILTMDATLNRSGNQFRGVFEVFDGEPFTFWDDYTHFRVEITDNNDTDSDGLPDLVALPEPGALAQASVVFVAAGLLGRSRRARN